MAIPVQNSTIIKNDPTGAHQYEFRGNWTASYSLTGSAASTTYVIDQWAQTITWGNQFHPILHGIQTSITTNSPKPLVPGDTGSYTITFHVPLAWSATDTVVTAASHLAAQTCLIQIDNLLLTGDCDTWTISFDAMRWYVGGVLKKTIGAQTMSGTNYNPRYNILANNVSAGSNPAPVIPPGPPGCTSSYATQDVQKIQTDASVQAGWRYWNGSVWVTPSIKIQNLGYTVHSDCNLCHPTMPGVTYTNSYDPIYTAETYFEDIKTDKGNQNCACDDGLGVPAVRRFWTLNRDYRRWTSSANTTPMAAPMREHTELVTVHCNGVDYTDSTAFTDSSTVSESYQESDKAKYFRTCSSSVSPGSCTIGVGSSCPSFGADITCHEEVEINVFWSVKPACSNSPSFPYIVQDDMGRLHECYIGAGDVYYRRSNDTRSADTWNGMNVQVTARGDVLKARFDYDAIYKRVELYFETTTHAVFYTYSKGDEGATWHTASSIGTPLYNFCTHTNHFNDDRVRTWFVYDAGTSGPGKAKGQYRRYADAAWSSTFTFNNSGVALAIADGGMGILAPGFTNQDEWLFSAIMNGDTTPTTWFSNDECRTWRQL